ncbi:MAG: T9SS type A sorting domain-containing protein [Saprospiraceae bacterium]
MNSVPSTGNDHSINNLQSTDRTTTPTPLASPSPNPFSDHLQVSYHLEEESPVTMRLLNATGQVVREWNSGELITAGEHSLSLNTAELPSGTYFLLIRSTDQQEQHLVIKQD